MRFAFPWALWAAGLAALATIALHFIAWRRPEPRVLPTARFVPRRSAPSRRLTLAPADLALLVLRVLAVVAIGLAVAGPVAPWRGAGVVRIVVADVSGAVARRAEVRDSVRALVTGVDQVRLVLLDSVPRAGAGADLEVPTAHPGPAPVAAALVLALREGAARRARGDSVEVVLVSPFVRASVDAAVPELVRAWGAPVRLVRVGAAVSPPPSIPPGAAIPGASDAVAAAAWRAWGRVPAHLRFVRGTPDSADLAFARDGGTLVTWPTDTTASGGGIVVGDAVAVGPFGHVEGGTAAPAVARWQDGSPAATERPEGAGCVRDVRIGVPVRGDVTLRPAFVAVVRALTAPCAVADLGPADPSLLRPAGGAGPLRVPLAPDPWLVRLLLLTAVAALGVEQWLRRRGREPARLPSAVVREAA